MLRTMGVVAVVVAKILFGLGASAQGVRPEPDLTMDAKLKTETITALVKTLNDYYVFPDLADKITRMLEQHQKHGDYNSINSAKDFAKTLTDQMFEVAHDPHLSIDYSAEVQPQERQQNEEPRSQPDPRLFLHLQNSNYGFDAVQRLNGNIGYLKFSEFMPATYGGPAAAAAMAFLSNTDAMIIDLRSNHGGTPGMVQLLASYLFSGDQPVHLNDLEYRKEGSHEYSTTQWWVLPYVPGQRYVDKEVYILTAHATFSAAEEFTYDLQALKRATIVGETTAGGANPRRSMRLGDHFSVFMPTGHAVNSVTKTNWESVGVKPDMKSPALYALEIAEKAALEHLIAKKQDNLEQHDWALALANAQSKIEEQKQYQIWMGNDLTLYLKLTRDTATGKVVGNNEHPITNGRLQGNQLSFEVDYIDPRGNPQKSSFTLEIAGNQIQGTMIGPHGTTPVTLTRQQN